MASQNNYFIKGTNICDSSRKKLQMCLLLQHRCSFLKKELQLGMSHDVHNYAGPSTVISTPKKGIALEFFNESLVHLDETSFKRKLNFLPNHYTKKKI